MISDEKVEQYRARLRGNHLFEDIVSVVGMNSNLILERDHMRLAVAMFMFIEGSLSWDTTCVNCSSLLDRLYAANMKLEKIEAIIDGS